MDPRLLEYYNTELKFLRGMGAEFAQEFPKIAGRLGLDAFECADPYVERLLEGCAFLASRIQLRLNEEYPKVTQHLLEMVYPHYLAPMPAMVVAQMQPDMAENALLEGYEIPKGTVLRSLLGKGEKTACEFRTAHDLTLWPLEIVEAEYIPNASSLPPHKAEKVKAGIRLRLKITGSNTFDLLPLDRLTIFLRGDDELPMRIYEQLFSAATGFGLVPVQQKRANLALLDPQHIHAVGFDNAQALLPYGGRSFSGYRLLQEYFAFPARYLFFELTGLQQQIARCQTKMVDIYIPLYKSDPVLEKKLDASLFSLFCTPAINLLKRIDSFHLNERDHEYHVVADRTRPMDYEVYSITDVKGISENSEEPTPFMPFYSDTNLHSHQEGHTYYTLSREPRRLSSKQKKHGPRSSYIGSEVSIALVDGDNAPYKSDLKQLKVEMLCTNRDLPLHMPLGVGKTDFTTEIGAPITGIRCLTGPSKPQPPIYAGRAAWRLVSHLSLNYLSLVNSNQQEGAAALREMLGLYNRLEESHIEKQIEGVHSIQAKPIVSRIPGAGPVTYGRGLEIQLTLEDTQFQGSGIFLLAAVIEAFFARSVSINSFIELVLRSVERGEIKRWPISLGQRHLL